MRFFIYLFIVCAAGITGCAPSVVEIARDDQKTEVTATERKQIVQAVTNLEPIGQHLESTGRKPEGKAVMSQAEVIEKAMAIKLEEKVAPTVSFIQWQLAKDSAAKAEELASQLEGEKKQLGSELEEKRKKLEALEKAVVEENNSAWSWAKAAGFATTALGIAAYVAKMLNVPGMQFVEPLIATLTPHINARAARAQQIASTASTAVIASDVGSYALSQLQNVLIKMDPDLKQRLPELIAIATNGQAKTIQDVFKMVAKGVATDEGKQMEVDMLLKTLRNDDAMPTKLGKPVALDSFFTIT